MLGDRKLTGVKWRDWEVVLKRDYCLYSVGYFLCHTHIQEQTSKTKYNYSGTQKSTSTQNIYITQINFVLISGSKVWFIVGEVIKYGEGIKYEFSRGHPFKYPFLITRIFMLNLLNFTASRLLSVMIIIYNVTSTTFIKHDID